MQRKLIIFLIFLFSLLLLFSFSACGEGDEDTDADDETMSISDKLNNEGTDEQTDEEEMTDEQTDEEEMTDEDVVDKELSSQETLVPRPVDIAGTIINDRPINYKKGEYGGTYVNYDLGDPATWNDSQSTDATSSTMISRFQPSLMDINYDTGEWEVFLGDHSKGETGPGYDLIVDEEQNNMEIKIYLRKDIYWSDNTRMRADEWVYYWNDIQGNPDVGHNGFNATRVEVEGEEFPIVAEKIDEFTFKYVFPIPIGDPELPISGGIMPMHIVKPVMESEGVDGLRQMWGIDTQVSELVGYGPWLPDTFEQGQNTIFLKNPQYFHKDEWNNRLPYLDKYVVNVVADTNAALLRFKGKELSMVSFPNSEFKTVVESADTEGYSVWNGGPSTGILFVTFNQNPNSDRMKGTPQLRWFSDKNFRQALNFLIDKEDLVSKVLNGLGEPDKGNLHPASPYFNPKNTFPNEYNPTRALSILEDELNIRDRNGDGILEDERGENITFELLTNAGNKERERVMSIIASNWGAYGIDVISNAIDFDNLVQKMISNFDWESMIMGLTGGIWPASGANVWRSSANLHFWHPYQDQPATEWETQVDNIFEEARNEPDFERRKKLWDNMYTILYDQIPYLLLYRKYSFLAIYDEWQNVYWDTMASVGGNYQQHLFKR